MRRPYIQQLSKYVIKQLLTVIILLTPTIILAENWDPHPMNQANYFSYQSSVAEYENIVFKKADSLTVNGSLSTKYVNAYVTHTDIAHCQNEILAHEPQFYEPLHSLIQTDILEYVADTIRYIDGNTGDVVNFFPFAQPNDEWLIVLSDANLPADSVRITCTSIEVENFLGITDSVKTYSVEPIGVGSIPSNIDNIVYKLSKNYGWLSYTPFSYFVHQNNNLNIYQLIGLSDSNNSYGFQQPQFQDYFPYQIGDVLFWKSSVSAFKYGNSSTNYYIDSITSVNTTASQASYQYSQTRLDEDFNFISYNPNQQFTIDSELLEGIINTEPEKLGVGNYLISPSNNTSTEYYWFINPLLNSIIDESITFGARAKFFQNAVNIDNCVVNGYNGIETAFSFNTKKGVVAIHKHIWDYESNSKILEAARMSTINFGFIPTIVGLNYAEELKPVHIYPNPVKSKLFIATELLKSEFQYEILDINGNILQSGKSDSPNINVQEFVTGMYILQIKNEDGNYVAKFLKQ